MKALFTDADSRMEVTVNGTDVSIYVQVADDDFQSACIVIDEDEARELIKFLRERLK